MADALGMSLDEIIQKNKKPVKTRKPQPKKEKENLNLGSTADKLVVSNLAKSVSQNDVRDLFKRIGPIKYATLNFDEKGNSKGIANVQFLRAGDAHKAFQEYHNRPLDNKPMKIELIINPDHVKKMPNLGAKKDSGIKKKERSKKQRVPKKPVTATDLDAEMDTYMAQAAESGGASLADALA